MDPPPASSPDSTSALASAEGTAHRATRAERRVRTAVYGVFVTFASVFVLLNATAITEQVFVLRAPAGAAGGSGPSPACAQGIGELSRALDRGVAATASAASEPEAVATMRAGMSPEWDREAQIAAACTADARGTDAWAALLRLRMAEEGVARRRAVDLAPVRRDVRAYLSP